MSLDFPSLEIMSQLLITNWFNGEFFPLVQGYNVDALTIDQVTPLHEACLGDHVGCARILLEAGANVSMAPSCKAMQLS